jgi:hypothetical protein
LDALRIGPLLLLLGPLSLLELLDVLR